MKIRKQKKKYKTIKQQKNIKQKTTKKYKTIKQQKNIKQKTTKKQIKNKKTNKK